MQTRASLEELRAAWRERSCKRRQNPLYRSYDVRYSRIYRAQHAIHEEKMREKLAEARRRVGFVSQAYNTLAQQLDVYQDLVRNLNGQLKQVESELRIEKSRNAPAVSREEPAWDKLPFVRNILNSESLCQSVLHMTQVEFEALSERFSDDILKHGLKGKKLKRRSSSTVSPRRKLFATLVFFSLYPSEELLGAYLNEHGRTCMKWVSQVLYAIGPILAKEIAWPTEDEFQAEKLKWQQLMDGVCEGVVCVIDGTEIQIEKPTKPIRHPDNKNHQLTWSCKKKQHSLSVQVISKLNGEMIFVSPAEKVHNDQQQWNSLDLRSRFIGKSYGIIADGGYTLNPAGKDPIIGKTPTKKQDGKLSPQAKRANTLLAQRRVVIENVNAQLKKWAILSHKFRHFNIKDGSPNIPIDLVVQFIAGLTNMRLKKRPLRQDGWLPPKAVPAVEESNAAPNPQLPEPNQVAAAKKPAPTKPRGPVTCSVCKQTGHNAKKHRKEQQT